MRLFPAIDMIDQKIVRLEKGDFDKTTYYERTVIEQAKFYEESGFKHLHLINLSGTLNPDAVVYDLLKEIKSETDLIIQFGGGIRSEVQINRLIDIGIDRIILSSILFDDPNALNIIKEKENVEFIAALDCKNEEIFIHGWMTNTQTTLNEYIPICAENGIHDFLITDIAKDGLLKGPNSALYRDLKAAFPEERFIASGGISSISDVEEMLYTKMDACIIGKAIYEGHIDVDDLVSLERNYAEK